MSVLSTTATCSRESRFSEEVSLRQQLRRTERRRKIKAYSLVLPLLIFVLVTFVLPISSMLFRSVHDPLVGSLIPRTSKALENWSPNALPSELAYASLAEELVELREKQEIGRLASRLNFEASGMRSLIMRTSRRVSQITSGPYKESLTELDARWKELNTWAVIKRLSSTYTATHFLAAVDMKYEADGDIVVRPQSHQIYMTLWWRTLWLSILITVFCLVLGYPVAYILSVLPTKHSNILLIFVLLPFWTSLLVRTTAWIVLLQSQGVINDVLVWVGLIADEDRIRMIYNKYGTLITMTQILLPYMILPLYSVMKTIPPSYMRAAQSLGANPALAFVRVYLPLSVPGIAAGCLLVFILSIGYYITPALVGGEDGQMISNIIAYHMKRSLNWGLAAALGTMLLVAIVVLYWLYDRLVGINKLKIG